VGSPHSLTMVTPTQASTADIATANLKDSHTVVRNPTDQSPTRGSALSRSGGGSISASPSVRLSKPRVPGCSPRGG
jgi:hypothetical protein